MTNLFFGLVLEMRKKKKRKKKRKGKFSYSAKLFLLGRIFYFIGWLAGISVEE